MQSCLVVNLSLVIFLLKHLQYSYFFSIYSFFRLDPQQNLGHSHFPQTRSRSAVLKHQRPIGVALLQM